MSSIYTTNVSKSNARVVHFKSAIPCPSHLVVAARGYGKLVAQGLMPYGDCSDRLALLAAESQHEDALAEELARSANAEIARVAQFIRDTISPLIERRTPKAVVIAAAHAAHKEAILPGAVTDYVPRVFEPHEVEALAANEAQASVSRSNRGRHAI